VLGVAGAGLATSLAWHLALIAGADVTPGPPWSWLLHAGAVAGFWTAGGRIAAAGLRGVAGILRIRRMTPIPVRLSMAAASLNALATAGLAAVGRGAPGRALTAYWTMMYLLIGILSVFVLPRLAAEGVGPAALADPPA
jgi:hypothetical protein